MTEQHRSFSMKLFSLALLAGFNALGAQASDVPEPSQFISEVIPIKYANVSDVAAALIRTATNRVGAERPERKPQIQRQGESGEAKSGLNW